MRQRSIHTKYRRASRAKEQARKQTSALNATRFVAAAIIKSAKWNKEGVTRNVAVGAKNTTPAFPEIGNNNDIRLVVAGARFDPRFPLSHVVGSSHIRVAVRPSDFQSTEFVDQEEVDHTRDSVRTVHSRRAIL